MKSMKRISLLISATLGLAMLTTSCGPNSKRGAVIGGLGGAGVGAIVGNQSGRGLEGAAIGAAAGAAGGALLGGARDDDEAKYEQQRREEERRYYDRRY